MPKQASHGSRRVVGLISGTSMDGIDAALVRISGPARQPRVRLLAFETYPYPDWTRKWLLEIAGGESTTAEEISQLNFFVGSTFAEAALLLCLRAGVQPITLYAIGSHGQTIFHRGAPSPSVSRRYTEFAKENMAELKAAASRLARNLVRSKKHAVGFSMMSVPMVQERFKATEFLALTRNTLQIGEAAVIAERTSSTVVADFRTADMAAGGQGAPLVPMVDYLLLRHARQGTVALNIGGIANFTVIPAGAQPEEVFGFDTGPGNMIIDGLVRHFTQGQKAYDTGGRWAARGQVIEPLLDEMLRLPFFSQPPPKSAGREQFGDHFLKRFFLQQESKFAHGRLPVEAIDDRQSAIENQRGARPEDLLRTATELTARSISGALDRFVLGKTAIHRLIISGGGAHNRLLMARLAELLPGLRVHRSDEFGLDVDAKEAIAFAVLADRTMHGLPGNLPSVTGARHPVVLGKISRP
jgi:anhydro-N-acetylmuramic acid kinase